MPDNMDPWAFLQEHTAARIAQGRTGHSLPTRALLDFQLDHARARDAVHAQLDVAGLLEQLSQIHPGPLHLHSQATDRQTYLHRPDLGRLVDDTSRALLASASGRSNVDLSVVVIDGLSATAVNNHAVPLLIRFVEEVKKWGWSMAPIVVVEQGRVAIGDEIAYAFGATLLLVLIGERPGLSSPDSLGAYLTYRPRPGLTDESRNCISNIRPEGLPFDFAVSKLLYLLDEMKTRQLSGVELKDEMGDVTQVATPPVHPLPHT